MAGLELCEVPTGHGIYCLFFLPRGFEGGWGVYLCSCKKEGKLRTLRCVKVMGDLPDKLFAEE